MRRPAGEGVTTQNRLGLRVVNRRRCAAASSCGHALFELAHQLSGQHNLYNLLAAVEAFEADPFVTATLGQALRDEFIRYKVKEWESYHQTVSDWEVERYSHLF